ncbi:MAG TPA: hypothetical protein VJ820_09330 [Propionibacteriaceae bacterium]|nr:hypothetical protein [Propionibacteriaceae bacterium]
MYLVDQPGTQVLPDRGGATGQSRILTIRRLVGALQGSFDAIGDEVEDGPPSIVIDSWG